MATTETTKKTDAQPEQKTEIEPVVFEPTVWGNDKPSPDRIKQAGQIVALTRRTDDKKLSKTGAMRALTQLGFSPYRISLLLGIKYQQVRNQMKAADLWDARVSSANK